ncbi:MAG: hypothetical protein KDB24_02745, partial [Microthrixaceae bacterium]|nr:hypothetical protein [Microthrixaceae bacterium]
MTIAKGVQWGEPGPLPPGRPVVADDAALAALVRAQVLSGETAAPIGLTGGDLLRTLGGGPARRRPDDPEAWRFPVDALVVRREGADDAEPAVAVAHLVAFRTSARRRAPLSRMPWFVTETLVVANAAFLGEWNIAPKGHPNDGRADVTRGVLPRRDR